MDGTAGDGQPGSDTWSTGPGTVGRAGAVDTAELDEAAGRLARAEDTLLDVAAGLDRLPVVAVATGADALVDALSDLGRQWLACLGPAAEEAALLAADLRTASAGYAEAELVASAAADAAGWVSQGVLARQAAPGPGPADPR